MHTEFGVQQMPENYIGIRFILCLIVLLILAGGLHASSMETYATVDSIWV